MVGIVVVFDFDQTLIDDDSDQWVVTEMDLTKLFNQFRPTLPWINLMDTMMRQLHMQGKTSDDIKECLQRIPMHPRVIAAIKSAHALGCDLWILSNSNQFFIETVLAYHGVLGYFTYIETNKTIVLDEDKRVRIFSHSDTQCSNLCPRNLCKGRAIDKIRDSVNRDNGKKRFIYVGDGRNDYCPTLRLVEGEHVMPRKDYPLCKHIYSDPTLIKADIHEWSDGEELEKILLQLIHRISTDSIQLNSSDHK